MQQFNSLLLCFESVYSLPMIVLGSIYDEVATGVSRQDNCRHA